MHRRAFLAASATVAGLPGLSSPAPADPIGTAPVLCDADRLVRVLVHAPGPETRKILALGLGEGPMLGIGLIANDAGPQHAGFRGLLRASGAEILEFTDLLEEALDQARAAGALRPWLERVAPRLAPLEGHLTAAALLGADDAFVYGGDPNDPNFHPLADPLKFLFFTRDLAVMTPRGVVLGNFVNRDRAFEVELTGFLFRWSPALARYPIVFDAVAEGVHLQGGDVLVADERTLLLGARNFTQEEAAPLLARRLGMDVVAVDLIGEAFRPGPRASSSSWTGLRTVFLHLDSVVNLVAPGVYLAPPDLLEAARARDNPLIEALDGLARHSPAHRGLAGHMARALARIGTIRIYRAGSGESNTDVRGLKLVDWLRARGDRIIPVAGEPPEDRTPRHMIESVMRELYYQAANVLATGPGRVLAVAGNDRTEAALRAAGIDVATFDAPSLVRWHGGPHCLSLPLERAADPA